MRRKMIMRQCCLLLLLWPVLAMTDEGEDLCGVNSCFCSQNLLDPGLIDILCKCSDLESFKVGPQEAGYYPLPSDTAQLTIEDCGDVDIMPRALNSVPHLKNLSLTKVQRVTLHSQLFESRSGQGQLNKNITNVELSAIRHLEVSRHAFEGLIVTGSFLLKDVVMRTVVSLAFSFDYVHEFSIFGSLFDRTSMWGFKLSKCGEFNILGGSRFYSLASNAFHMQCNKFMLAYNIFDSIQDASMSVQYGLADIQGNSFEKMTGKPFVDLKPMTSRVHTLSDGYHIPSGLVFRENKFALDPTLPFNAFSMPGFYDINTEDSYVDIESNHFVCDCDRMGWMLAAVQHGFDADLISSTSGEGSLDFLKQLYQTSGFCLKCGLRSCEPSKDRVVDFGASALSERTSLGVYSCQLSGQPIKHQYVAVPGFEPRPEPTFLPAPTTRAPITTRAPFTTRSPFTTTRAPKIIALPTENWIDQEPRKKSQGWDSNLGEEEDLAELKNLELNASKNVFESKYVNCILLLGSIFYLAASRNN